MYWTDDWDDEWEDRQERWYNFAAFFQFLYGR